MKTRIHLICATTLAVLSLTFIQLQAQTTAFSYQGQLTQSGVPISGYYDLKCSLWDSDNETALLLAGPVTNNAVVVSNGLFTVALDFGASVYDGSSLWLEIGVATNGGGNFTILSPRQALTPTPYALYAASADAANLSGTLPAGSLDPSVGLWTSSGADVYRNSGGVAVGATSPETTLDVRGTITSQFGSGNNDNILIKKTGAVSPSNNRFVLSHRTSGTQFWLYSYDGSTFRNLQEWDHANYSVNFPANGNTLHLDLANSLVGIGTSSPSSILHLVNNGPDISLKLKTAGSWTAELRQTDSSILSLVNGGSARFSVTPNGRFGFNTTTPNAALHVISDFDPGLRLEAASDSGQDTGMTIVGARNASTTVDSAFIDLRDFDSDEGSGEEFTMARIGAGMADTTGKTGFLRFYTSGGLGPMERMIIDKNGNVGIGKGDLFQRLEVAGDVAIGGGTALGLEDGESETLQIRGRLDDWYLGVLNRDNINDTSFFLGLNDADYTRFHFTRSGDLGIGTVPTSDLHLARTGSVRLHLEADTDNSGETDQPSVLMTQDGGVNRLEVGFFDSNNSPSIRTLDSNTGVADLLLEPEGGVGIGTTAPQSLLDVQGTGTSAGGVSGSDEVVGRFHQTVASTHTALTIDALADQDSILYFAENGSAEWSLRSDAVDPSWVVPLFNLRYHDGGVNQTAVRVVPAGGSVGFWVQPGQDDTVSLGTNPSGFDGRAFHDVVAYDFTNVSDRRSKRDIRDLDYGIEELMSLRPVRFRWKSRPDDPESLGVIAQEVQEVIPEVVSGDTNDPESYLGVRYAEIVPVLIRGIQDQQRQINQLQAQNHQLVSRLAELETLVDSAASRKP